MPYIQTIFTYFAVHLTFLQYISIRQPISNIVQVCKVEVTFCPRNLFPFPLQTRWELIYLVQYVIVRIGNWPILKFFQGNIFLDKFSFYENFQKAPTNKKSNFLIWRKNPDVAQ